MPETTNCDPAVLTRASACYCFNEPQARAVMVYLLAQVANDTSTPKELAAKAKCYCFNQKTAEAVITYLLCQIANGGGSDTCGALSGSGDPTGSVTPQFLGQLYHDTVADSYYRSTGLTSADWVAISGGGAGYITTTPPGLESLLGSFAYTDIPTLTKLAFDQTTVVPGFDIDNTTTIQEIDFPNLVSITGSNGTGLSVNSNTALTKVSAPLLATNSQGLSVNGNTALVDFDVSSLTTVGSDISITGNTSLLSLDLSSLGAHGFGFYCNGNTLLSSILLPLWVPTDGKTLDFSACALDATTVELILRRCVLAGLTTATIRLNGGTSVGLASLSAQGQADAATLGAQLTINP